MLRVRFAFSAPVVQVKTSLRKQGLGLVGSWREVNMRLAGQLYQLAMSCRLEMPDVAQYAFRAAMRCWKIVELLDSDEHALAPHQRRKWHGMRGVSHLFLARKSVDGLPHLRAAIKDLEIAEDHGDNTSQHFGLLGYAYYRLGYRTNSVVRLRRALGLKENDRRLTVESGDIAANGFRPARESWSVSAAAAFQLWTLTGDAADFTAAAEFSALAVATSPIWPWPLLQLAQYTAAAADMCHGLPAGAPSDPVTQVVADQSVWDRVRAGDSKWLTQIACERAAGDPDLRRPRLGGRSGVYILDDPHALLSAALVFKPCPSVDAAQAEQAKISDFAAWLEETGSPSWARCINALAVVDDPLLGTTVSVTRRSAGRQLSDLIGEWVEFEESQSLPARIGTAVERALTLLAYVHAWRGPFSGRRRPVPVEADKLRDRLITLGSSAAVAANAARSWREVVPAGLPLLGKRDAHTENWLVTDLDDVVVLDLEATGWLPLGFEVAQLLEDMPLLPLTDPGLELRKKYASGYLAQLARLRPDLANRLIEPDSDIWQRAYACFAVQRAVYLLQKFRRTQSVLARRRIEHSRALLRWAGERFDGLHAIEKAIGSL
ncbi:hypothetical protein [Actinoplanes italicus]|nr:hypothetical protein [Actinoplanes italicus]